MDEAQFYKMIFPLLPQERDVVVGPGDDCAAVDLGLDGNLLLLAADQLNSDIHYDLKRTEPEQAGAKLLKRNLSDIASMGGRPLHAIITIATGNFNPDWLRRFYEGLGQEATAWSVSICGGDLATLKNTGSGIAASLFITGLVHKDRMCLRNAMRPGDLLYATGEFGRSFETGHHLSFTPRLKEAVFLAGPFTRAMMDVSDGLLLDASRMASASHVGIRLCLENIPRRDGCSLEHALSDGEDYELLFSVPKDKSPRLENEWPFTGTLLTRIGEVVGEHAGIVTDLDDIDLSSRFLLTGFDHLKR